MKDNPTGIEHGAGMNEEEAGCVGETIARCEPPGQSPQRLLTLGVRPERWWTLANMSPSKPVEKS